MKGLVCTEVLAMAEEAIGEEAVDELLDTLDFDHDGAYTSVGNYPCFELMQIVSAVSARTGLTGGQLQFSFGAWMHAYFLRSHGEMFFTQPFDIVLMDVNMPVMDGLQAADLIRQGPRNHGRPQVPIIALTANVMVHQVRKYLNAGVDAHVPKPIKRERLVSVMLRLLSDYAECAPLASAATKASTSAGVLPSAS